MAVKTDWHLWKKIALMSSYVYHYVTVLLGLRFESGREASVTKVWHKLPGELRHRVNVCLWVGSVYDVVWRMMRSERRSYPWADQVNHAVWWHVNCRDVVTQPIWPPANSDLAHSPRSSAPTCICPYLLLHFFVFALFCQYVYIMFFVMGGQLWWLHWQPAIVATDA